MTRIIPFRGADELVVERVGAIRAAGDVPLIGDERWSNDHWESVCALVDTSPAPAGTGWATLTSGSSGTPRIIVRTAESWRSSFATVSALWGAASKGGVLLPAPPSSSLTLFSVAHALDGDGPSPAIGRRGGDAADAACFHGTPQALRALLEDPSPRSVRTALIGGSALDPELRAEAEAQGIRVVSYYGAAELSFVALDDGTGLRAFPGVDLEIREGMLWVRSPFLALGYLGGAGPLRVEGDWATVGDLAEIVDGVLRLRGRADGAILTASATVIPEEVEAALRSLPGVADALVFGVPAAGVGELIAALIEPDGRVPDAAALRRRTADVLAPPSRPRIWYTGELPRTSSGKPARAEALRRALAGEVSRLAR